MLFIITVLNNGAAYADLDNDGDLDLVTNNIDQEAFVYQNNSSQVFKNNYLSVHLNGDNLNRFGIGAKIKVYLGSQLLFRECEPSHGFQSAVDCDINFGLGHATVIDSLRIIWPSGKTEIKKGIRA